MTFINFLQFYKIERSLFLVARICSLLSVFQKRDCEQWVILKQVLTRG